MLCPHLPALNAWAAPLNPDACRHREVSDGQEQPVQGMSDTVLSSHTVLASRIRENELRLMDLDLISSALQRKHFLVNLLTTYVVP